MTPGQRALLEDKLALWRQASTQGSMEMRDYNRRCADALELVLTPPDRVAQSEMRESLRAAGRKLMAIENTVPIAKEVVLDIMNILAATAPATGADESGAG